MIPLIFPNSELIYLHLTVSHLTSKTCYRQSQSNCHSQLEASIIPWTILIDYRNHFSTDDGIFEIL